MQHTWIGLQRIVLVRHFSDLPIDGLPGESLSSTARNGLMQKMSSQVGLAIQRRILQTHPLT
jgi:hypothetical protein